MTAVVSGEIEYVRQGGTLTYEGIALLQDIIAGSGGGGGVSDGDKGDVVVSGGGTTWTIEPDAVRSAFGYDTTATSGGTTTLTAASADVQVFTGTLVQTVVLPDVTTLTLGRSFTLINEATAGITVQSSGLNNFPLSLQEGQTVRIVCVSLTGTSPASWVYRFDGSRGRTGLGNLAVFNRGPTFRDTPVFTASDATFASLRMAHGVAPSAPTNGDVWTTTAGMFVQVNGATVGPLAASAGFVIENRTSDPGSPVSGQIWLRTDL